jgi:predicted nucleic acid-binding protein
MIAYLDSSVILRILLRQPHALREWNRLELGVASVLVQVECLRTLDRLRPRTRLTDEVIARRREAVYQLMEHVELVDMSNVVLERASQPFAAELGTLDAIHLASALLWQEATGQDLVMATHDQALATAARSMGLRVAGVSSP